MITIANGCCKKIDENECFNMTFVKNSFKNSVYNQQEPMELRRLLAFTWTPIINGSMFDNRRFGCLRPSLWLTIKTDLQGVCFNSNTIETIQIGCIDPQSWASD